MLICFGLSFSIKDTFKLDNLFSDNEYITSYETENNKMIVVYAHERDDNDIYYHIKVYNKFLFLYFKDENYYRVKKVSSKDNEYFELTFLEIEKSQYCFVDFNYSNIESLKINGKIIEKDGEYTMFILYDLNKESKIEVAFFGGSFTGIDVEKQEEFLQVAYEYIKQGKVHSIRISTRPDYINKEKNLKIIERFFIDKDGLMFFSL